MSADIIDFEDRHARRQREETCLFQLRRLGAFIEALKEQLEEADQSDQQHSFRIQILNLNLAKCEAYQMQIQKHMPLDDDDFDHVTISVLLVATLEAFEEKM